MPAGEFMERVLPLPSLRVYLSTSVLVLALAVFHAHWSVSQMGDYAEQDRVEDVEAVPIYMINLTLPYPNEEHWLNVLYVMKHCSFSLLVLINTCYFLLILLIKLIQTVVFGELRVIERQHVQEKFWSFVFYKFIFIFGVMNVQSYDELFLWVAWFSVVGFLLLLTLLCNDRSEYLSSSPATPRFAHIKLMSLLLIILSLCFTLLAACVWVGFYIGFAIFIFLASETLLVLLKCMYVLLRYIIHLWDLNLEGVWEARSSYLYYTDLIFELMVMVLDFGYHLHMLLYGNIFLSMASLVICMQLRYLFYELQRRIKKHKNYLRVVKDMESRFPMATQEDLEQNADDCAICWEKLVTARKLPCGHLFHNSCLRSWLEQDTSCPTCRKTLSENSNRDRHMAAGPVRPANPANAAFFHFDGSRYVSWLPSFSVEVTHTSLLGQQVHATQTSQLDNMAREVQSVFPNIPQSVIIEDLRLTRSVDLTIDNILEGHVVVSGVPVTSASTMIVENLPVTSSPTSEILLRPSDSDSVSTEASHSSLDSNVPGASDSQASHFESLNAAMPSVITGSRFSKSASERMNMLEKRKQAMLEQAKRNYHETQERLLSAEMSSSLSQMGLNSVSQQNLGASSAATSSATHNSITSVNDLQARRRAVLLEATQRRLAGGNTSTSREEAT